MSDILSRMKSSFKSGAGKLGQKIKKLFPQKVRISQEMLNELEDALICSDMGASLANNLISKIPKNMECDFKDLKLYLSRQLVALIGSSAGNIVIHPTDLPTVIVMCGVNGNGKTTTIGKLARHYFLQGKKVVIAAADTFRAAAEDQVAAWSEKSNSTLIRGKPNADPASVVFTAMSHCIETKKDILLIDTAGRLPNQINFMKELEKIVGITKKHNGRAPHNIILVLDATTGQNALVQIEQFKKAVGITGLIITKLDSSAKGGVVVAIAHRYPEIKIHSVGFGEGIEDLANFDPIHFAENLLDCKEK